MVEFIGPNVVNVMASASFDFIVIDCEHGNQNPRDVEIMIEAGWQAGICTIVRPPDTSRGMITRTLDAGAAGVLVPFIETMDQVRQVVNATKYLPIGRRGSHFSRGHTRHERVDPTTFIAEANLDLLTLIQIELAGAVKIVDQIAATEGVDGLYIGPGDLGLELGVPGQWDAPMLRDAIRTTAAACMRHGKIMGCHIRDIDETPALAAMGVQMFGIQHDIGMYKEIVSSKSKGFRKTLGLTK